MPAIRKVDRPSDYEAADKAMRESGDNNFCGPLALAMLTGCSPSRAQAFLETAGRPWRKGTTTAQMREAFKALGFKMEYVKASDFISKYPGVHKNLISVTSHHPRRFPEAFKGENLLIQTNNHYVAVANGEAKCYAINRSLRAIWIYRISNLYS